VSQSDMEYAEISKKVQTTLFASEVAITKTIEAMNEAGVDPATAAIDLILTGFQQIDAAEIDVQFNILALVEKKLRQHYARLEEEGHSSGEF